MQKMFWIFVQNVPKLCKDYSESAKYKDFGSVD